MLDVGCGNGRLSRLLAPAFPRVLGVDLSPAAVDLARRESAGDERAEFGVADVTADGAGAALAAELGPANVVVRGVFHVLDREHRRRAARELATVLGGRGRLLLLETNWRGDLLGYLEHLGADRGRLPAVLARLDRPPAAPPAVVRARASWRETFPAPGWTTLASGPVDIDPVRGHGPAAGRTIPGFSAVLRTGAAAREGAEGAASELGA